jgi:hypothetical protein
MKNVTLIPGPSWIEYLLTLKMSPFILKIIKINWEVIDKQGSEAVEHQATIEPSAKALHHETVFQFCDHHNSMMDAS